MRADVALQCQAFHRVKRRLNPALNVIITRLQHWDLPDVIGIALGTTTYFHGISSLDVPQNNNPSLNFYHPGRETYSTCKIHLAYTGKLAGLLHIVWDREGTRKCWACIIISGLDQKSPLRKCSSINRQRYRDRRLSYLRSCG